MSEDDKPSVKAKLPSAREISRTDFTPHGIKSKGGAKSSGLTGRTAAEAQRRRRTVLVISVLTLLAVAGVTTYIVTRPGPKITVTGPGVKLTGAYGKDVKVDIPKDLKQPTTTVAKTLITGRGTTVAKGDTAFVNFAAYAWNEKPYKSKMIGQSTFKSGKPMAVQLGGGQVLPGLAKGLTGQKVGSRVMIEIPPKDGLGDRGNPQYGIDPADTLVFVADIVGTYNQRSAASGTPQKADPALPTVTDNGPGKAPTVTIPKSNPPADLKIETLIEGNGPVVAKGQTLVMQYHGVLWRDGQMFDSSWKPGASPFATSIGTGQVIPGWDKGLVGQKVGSRVLLVIPPKDGYGPQGSGTAIKGTDTMVFVADIIAAF